MSEVIYTILMSNRDETIEVEWTEGTLSVEFQQQSITKSPKDYNLSTVLEIITRHEYIMNNLRHDIVIKFQCFSSKARICGEDVEEMIEEFFPIGIRKEIK